MSTIDRCDICHKIIKDHNNSIKILGWNSKIPWHDLCLKCWTDPSKWQQIHEIKNPLEKI